MMKRALSLLSIMLVVTAVIEANAPIAPRSATESPAIFDGRPVFRAGVDRGYYVWRDGNEWHVRWTSSGRPLTFSGHVSAEGGDLEDLDRVDLEKESRLVRTGSRPVLVRGPRGRVHYEARPTTAVVTRDLDRVEKDGDRVIRFHARTNADIDGFDFEVDADVRALRFVLEVDGVARAVEVEAGRGNVQPAGNPFVVVLH